MVNLAHCFNFSIRSCELYCSLVYIFAIIANIHCARCEKIRSKFHISRSLVYIFVKFVKTKDKQGIILL